MSLFRKLAVVPALLVGLSLASCERTLSAPETPHSTAPSFSQTADLSSYTRIEGQIPGGVSTEASRVISVGGGSVELAGYRLDVPAGAVEEPAVFTLSLLPTGYVEVNLSAIAVSAAATVSNLGEAGFKNGKTVRATLSYANATNVKDPSKLLILRMLKDGKVEPLKSTVDTGSKSVSVELDHFSKYCLASN